MDGEGENYADLERSPKGTIPSNYIPITCLPMMGKILTTLIREEIYSSLECCGLFPEELIGCYSRTSGKYDKPFIDKQLFKGCQNKTK